MQKKKILTSVNLTPEIKEMVENYKEMIGASYSVAAESLIVKGLTNLEEAQNIIDIQKAANKKLNESIKNIEKRFESTLFTILRTVAADKEMTKAIVQGIKVKPEQVRVVEESGIKKAFASLKGEDLV